MSFNPFVDASELQKSRDTYFKQIRWFQFFFYPLNDLCSLFFKKRINRFHQETNLYVEDRKKRATIVRRAIAYAYMKGEYTHTQFGHYSFDIEGQNYILSYVELNDYGLLDIVDKLKYANLSGSNVTSIR